jgi:hypothetical protein
MTGPGKSISRNFSIASELLKPRPNAESQLQHTILGIRLVSHCATQYINETFPTKIPTPSIPDSYRVVADLAVAVLP